MIHKIKFNTVLFFFIFDEIYSNSPKNKKHAYN